MARYVDILRVMQTNKVRINYLQGCIRECGYLIKVEISTVCGRYGQASKDARIAAMIDRMHKYRMELAEIAQ